MCIVAILLYFFILGRNYYHINIKRVILVSKIMYSFVLLWIFWRGLCTRTDAFCPFHETTLMRSRTADCRCFITSTKNRLSTPSISDFIFCGQVLQHLLSWQRVNKCLISILIISSKEIHAHNTQGKQLWWKLVKAQTRGWSVSWEFVPFLNNVSRVKFEFFLIINLL